MLKENEKNNIIVKDYSGNKQELSYNVDWIDKEKPKIIGAVNNGSYNSPLNLLYSDNVGIKNVEIENRGFLYSEINLTSFDIENRQAFDYRATSCKVNVIQKPTDTKKLQFFIDGKLSGETTQNTYTFKNLTTIKHVHKDAIEATILNPKYVGTFINVSSLLIIFPNIDVNIIAKLIESGLLYTNLYELIIYPVSVTSNPLLIPIKGNIIHIPIKINFI